MNNFTPAGPDNFAHLLRANDDVIVMIYAAANAQGWTKAEIEAAIADAHEDEAAHYFAYWS